MKWILILVSMYGHQPMTTAVFEDRTACENAANDAKKFNPFIRFVCVPDRST
ncbi:hypothetical protein [Azospirillum himalayense]|uniref:Uncharacterized protein n=1 Tax=Azospirillum himalayense TaxID=654847 RepID=A0ABW0FYH9_9PROT